MSEEKFRYLGNNLEKILEEVAGYQIDLETDPTRPHLGARYLNEVLARCRNYTNRTIHYLQLMKRQERDLRMAMKLAESNLDFKLKEKLADDPVVRAQPSIEDRMALATVALKEEYLELAQARADLLETEETVKLIKTRLDNLRQTSFDIKLQRQIVKDDKDGWGSGEGGYVDPQKKKDRTVPDGMRPPVRPSIDPEDLLDPSKRPADMPVPVDSVHAAQIADFFNGQDELPVSAPEGEPEPRKPEPAPEAAPSRISYAALLQDD
jgi:hypothetical protein